MTPDTTRSCRLALMLPAMLCLALPPCVRAQEQPGQPPTAQPDSPSESQPVEQPGTQPAEAAPAGNVDPAAKEILQAMSDAIANATSIRASIKTTVTGSLSNVTPSTEAVVRLRKADSGWLIRVTGSGTRAGQPTNFDVAWGGGSITWLDHKEKKLVGRPQNEARGGSYALASQAMPTQIVEAVPFNKELSGEEITHAGTDEVDGQTCDLLHVRYPKRKTLLKLWIAQSDHMLRKLERATETTKITSSTVQELTDVAMNKDISDSDLTISAPDGYTSDVTTPQHFEKGRPATPHTPSPAPAKGEGDEPSHSPATIITPPGAEPANHAPSATPSSTPSSAPAQALGAGVLPSTSLTLSDGSTLTTDSLRGKPAVIMFWGTWCLPARDAIEPLSKFAATLKEPGVPVIACAVRERTKDAAADYLKNFQPRNRTGDDKIDTSSLKIVGSADTLARELAITRYPTFLAIDAEGKIVKRLDGFDPTKTIDEVRSVVAP